MYDVAILGAGVAGATAAYKLRDRKVLLLEAEPFIGGRTYSEQYGDRLWANFGAGYFSSDKTTIIGLGDEVGAKFIPFDDTALTGDYLPEGFTKDDISEIRQIKRRIADEQRNHRDASDPELDNVTFEEWLGPVRPNVRDYWEFWCSTMSGPMSEVSLYGVLLMSGPNRTAAFSDQAVEYDPRGNLVVEGGNGLIAERLVDASSADVHLSSPVRTVERTAEGNYTVSADTADGPAKFEAKSILCTLPAPVVRETFADLPDWKIEALEAIHYGLIIGIPIVVGPEHGDYPRYQPSADFRADAVYCETDFLLRSPTDLDARGAYFVCQVYDIASRLIWSDSDESIRAGAYSAFQNRFPELASRVQSIGVHRWQHGLPQYTPGRMAVTPALVRPVDGLFFCGDYTDVTHTDGAAKSALRAATEVRAFLNQMVEA